MPLESSQGSPLGRKCPKHPQARAAGSWNDPMRQEHQRLLGGVGRALSGLCTPASAARGPEPDLCTGLSLSSGRTCRPQRSLNGRPPDSPTGRKSIPRGPGSAAASSPHRRMGAQQRSRGRPNTTGVIQASKGKTVSCSSENTNFKNCPKGA